MPAAARHRRTRSTRHRVRECARLGGIPATYSTSYIDTTAQNLIDQINATLQVWQTTQTNWNVALSQTHARDALGRITQTQETLLAQAAPTRSYTYDPAGRLTSATIGTSTTTWGYDLNGNRIAENGAQIATYDSEDRLQSWKGNTYAYNAAGDLASKTTPAGATSYTYDAQGSLRKVTLANGKTITYAIDPAGRRTGKTVNGALQWQLVWLNELRPLARLKANNTLDQTYYYGDKPNVPEAMTTSDGKTYRIVSDQNGSVRLVIDASTGEVAQQIDYDTWGQITNDTNPGFQPFGFAGGLHDPDTGLTRFGVRDYDAETGRWTAKDPILFGGGDSNLYGYVQGDPVNFTDTAGLATDCEVNAAVQVLREAFPELLIAPKSVTGVFNLSGTLGQTLAGRTDLSGNIKYSADLYGYNGVPVFRSQEDNFLQTMAHEMQHLNESWRDRIGLNIGEWANGISPKLPSIEDIIDHNADLMYKATINKFKDKIHRDCCQN